MDASGAAGHLRHAADAVPDEEKRLKHAHSFLFALAPLLALYSVNRSEVAPTELLRPAALILGASLVLYLLLYLLLARRDAARASLTLSAFLLLFFTFDQFYWPVSPLRGYVLIFVSPYAASADSSRIALPLWGMACAAALWLCLRSRKDLSALCWVVGLALVVPSVARLVSGGIAQQQSSRAVAAPAVPTAESLDAAGEDVGDTPSNSTPDLYLIVLDGYGRQDLLQRMYGLDNRPFVNELEKRGFFVARRSRSNYIQTVLSLAATLNLEYLTPGSGSVGSLDTVQPKIDRNLTASLLRERGYQFVSAPTGFPLTAAPSADLTLATSDEAIRQHLRQSNAPFPTQFEGMLIDKTPFAAVPRRETHLYDEHRQRLLDAFGYVATAAKLPYPKFVFAHIVAPHPPFVFGPNGERRQPDRPFTLGDGTDFHEGDAAYRKGYADQVRFLNRQVLAAVNAIQKNARRPAVIILMGDHGPRSETNWRKQKETNAQEAFSNLLAVSYPAGDARSRFRKDAGEEITPINALRLVLNHEFGMSYRLLPNNSYYSTMQRPFDFTDVTAEARTEAAADNDSSGNTTKNDYR